MKNKKGQALVEFVLVLPVLIIILLCMVDFGNIISKKYSLENDLDTVVDLYNNQQSDQINDFVSTQNDVVEYSEDNNYIEIKLKKNVKVNAPVLNKIMGHNYNVAASRKILKEDRHETE